MYAWADILSENISTEPQSLHTLAAAPPLPKLSIPDDIEEAQLELTSRL